MKDRRIFYRNIPDKRTDTELVKDLLCGKQSSYEELISRYSVKAFGLIRRLVQNNQDAEEALQDVFTTVFRKLQSFEGKSSFASWFYRIAVNSALMRLRKRRQDRCVSMDDAGPQFQQLISARSLAQSQVDNLAYKHELVAALEGAIAKLPQDYRPVFILRDVDGLSSTEVGKILSLSIPTVKSRLHRSRLMLRRRLKQFYSVDEQQHSRAAGE